jgi:hypothetical protein
MKLSQFTTHLRQHPERQLTFILPDGDRIPAHFHITEAGRIDKSFIDCGATIRTIANCSLQAWVADDTDHRLTPGKLAGVLQIAAPLFKGDDLDVELEYEDCSISQYPVLEALAEGTELVFQLGSKHTDCLAKELCVPQSTSTATTGCCTPGGGCC